MNIMNLLSDDGYVESKMPKNFEALYKDVSDVFGAKNLGFHLRIMKPKSFSWPYHWHTREEELVIVLEGEATVRNNGEFRIIKKGDLVFYGTGPESVHHMYNHTDKPFKFLMLSHNSNEDQCFYPDSKKQTDPQGILQNGVVVNYFKDEEDPSIYWPKDKL